MGNNRNRTALGRAATGLCRVGPVLLLAGCPGSLDNLDVFLSDGAIQAGPDTGVVDEDCDYVVDQILSNTESCAFSGCHGAASNSRNLDLETDDIIGRLSGVAASASCPDEVIVDPVDPAQSLLYTKLTANPPCGGRMPVGGALGDADIACVLTWIQANVTTTSTESTSDSDVIYLEAEDATIRAPFTVRTDPAASGGEFVTQDGIDGDVNDVSTDPSVGQLTFTFSVPRTAPTQFWARVRAATIDNNSFWFRIDGSDDWIRYNEIETGTGFIWGEIRNSDLGAAAVTETLSAGTHTIDIVYREPNAHIDQIFISQDDTVTP